MSFNATQAKGDCAAAIMGREPDVSAWAVCNGARTAGKRDAGPEGKSAATGDLYIEMRRPRIGNRTAVNEAERRPLTCPSSVRLPKQSDYQTAGGAVFEL